MTTRITVALVLFAVVKCCHGQLPVLPFAPMVSASVPIPQQIPGLAYWWRATDSLATNAAVTNWYDRIQNVLQTNGNASLRPQNSSGGIVYPTGNNSIGLTNVAISIGNNWTIVVFIKKTETGYESTIQHLLGKKDLTFLLGFLSGAGSTVEMSIAVSGTPSTVGGHNIPLNIEYDLTYMNSNGTTAKFLAWTNAVGVANIAGFSTSLSVDCFGANSGLTTLDHTSANVREFLIYTQLVSQANISLLHSYRTNTYGAP